MISTFLDRSVAKVTIKNYCFYCFNIMMKSHFNPLLHVYFVWLKTTDEGSILEMHIWCIS